MGGVVDLKPLPGSVRPPAVAGMFYPADADECRRAARQLFEMPEAPPQAGAESQETSGAPQQSSGARLESRRWIGGIVPHAGWICSGAIAAQTIWRISQAVPAPDVVVVFGAVHTPVEIEFAAFDSHARWAVPGGQSDVAQDVAAELSGASRLFAVEPRLHEHEHAVEVELPLIQAAWPGAAILPVELPLIERAPEMGRATFEALRAAGRSAVFLASSDLTHYGPAYRFAPGGIGPQGLQWAKENDRRLLDVVTGFDPQRVVAEVSTHANACGGGAIAAMMAACQAAGATAARVLRHASSYETLMAIRPQPPTDAVGYAAVVVG